MNFLEQRQGDPAAQELRRRVLEVLPAGGYQLDRLFRLLDVEVSEEVATAEVTVGLQSRLRINPQFVERHCRSDESLFVLVLHELLHVVLGHTRLFPKPTFARNIAFDAVINAMIARQHPQPEFLELMCAVHSWEDFPARLLRPAPGWPQAPQPLPADATATERELHARLYGQDNKDVTYHELFELLSRCIAEQSAKPVLLMGGHGGVNEDEPQGDGATDPTLRDVLERLVREWPAPFREQMLDRGLREHDVALRSPSPPDPALERALVEFFRRAGVIEVARRTRLRRASVERTTWSIVPQGSDRRGQVRAAVTGRLPLYWETSAVHSMRRRQAVPAAFVYLDVSGSMDCYLDPLRAALQRPVRDGAARLFAFSTSIVEVDVRTFGSRATQSTGGTDIDAVLTHVLELPQRTRPRRIAIVTDGYVGTPRADLLAKMLQLRIDVHVALVANGRRADLQGLARQIVDLPAPAVQMTPGPLQTPTSNPKPHR